MVYLVLLGRVLLWPVPSWKGLDSLSKNNDYENCYYNQCFDFNWKPVLADFGQSNWANPLLANQFLLCFVVVSVGVRCCLCFV